MGAFFVPLYGILKGGIIMSERTIAVLLNYEERVYVYLRSESIAKIFMKKAAAEGFSFGDGAELRSRHMSDIFALNDDFTINYVGWAGHMAFRCMNTPIVRIDYGRYISGSDSYIITDLSQL
jgi:hypothetical protein